METVAATDVTVLILGETGTGKEVIARAIHHLSPRNEHVMVKMNCAAIPAGLLESELFGHEKGAFTGALDRKIGRLELAHEGTLFLDEIGDLPLELQPKILRALQEKEFERLGSTKPSLSMSGWWRRPTATWHKWSPMGTFGSDLYYRLRVFPDFASSASRAPAGYTRSWFATLWIATPESSIRKLRPSPMKPCAP